MKKMWKKNRRISPIFLLWAGVFSLIEEIQIHVWYFNVLFGIITWAFLYGAIISAENRGKEKVEIKRTTINVTGETTFTVGQGDGADAD